VRKTTQFVRTCKSLVAKKIVLCHEEIISALTVGKEILRERDQIIIASKIMDIIDKELHTCPRLESRKLIMERVLSNTTLATSMPNSFLPPKVVIAMQELVVGMCISLVETKQANSNAKLVVKHCIFRTSISVGASSTRGIVQMFSVHHWNICATIVD
jgi:hypothetical protein